MRTTRLTRSCLVGLATGLGLAGCGAGAAPGAPVGAGAGGSVAGGGAPQWQLLRREPLVPRMPAETLDHLLDRCQHYEAPTGERVLTQGRPEIVLDANASGAATLGGWVVYTVRDGRDGQGKVLRSPDCQHRQQRFGYAPAMDELSFGAEDPVLDLLPALPEPTGTKHDFCTTRDLRISAESGGRMWASVTLNTGALAPDGRCLAGAQVPLAVFADLEPGASAPFEPRAMAPTIEVEEPGKDAPSTPCGSDGHMWMSDDIHSAIVGGDDYSATYCGHMQDPAGKLRRFYLVYRHLPGQPDFAERYEIPVYDPSGPMGIPPVWFDVGGKQGALIGTDPEGVTAIGTFFYAAQDPATGRGRLAWFEYDFDHANGDGTLGDFARDAGGAIVGGLLPRPAGVDHYLEKYPVGVARDDAGRYYLAYLWNAEDEYCPGGGQAETPCFQNSAGHLALRVLDAALGVALEEHLLLDEASGGDVPSLLDPAALRMAPFHPDLVFRDGHLLVTYGLAHYPASGCGEGGTEPCRGQDDSVVHTSMLEIWRVGLDPFRE